MYNHNNEVTHKTHQDICEDYLRNEITEASQMLTVDRINDLVDHIMQIHKGDQYTKTKLGNSEKTDIMRQNGNETSDKHECKNQAKNWEMTITTPSRRRIWKADGLCYDCNTKTVIKWTIYTNVSSHLIKLSTCNSSINSSYTVAYISNWIWR